MTVYVDPLVTHGWRFRGVPTKSCHMLTDGPLEELHAMAEAIGLKRAWFQEAPPASFPHYDLTPSRRAAAVAAGAVELDRRGLVDLLRKLRAAR